MTNVFKNLQKVDFAILDFVQSHIVNRTLDKIMPCITHLASGGILWIAVSLFFMATKKFRRTGITVAIALILCLVICNLTIKPLFARVRPFILGNWLNNLIIAPPQDFSFPSGHTTASFAAAVSILLCKGTGLGVPAIILAALIGFSRLYLYVHYPSDVFFGALLGTLLAFLAFMITNMLYKNVL